MRPHWVPPPRDDKAALTCRPTSRPPQTPVRIPATGSCTTSPSRTAPATSPHRAPGYAEQVVWPFGEWLDALAEIFGPDHAQVIAQRGREAGQ